MQSKSSLLAPLGIHGWERIEPVIFAGILLGEPTLLVGEPGSAKTYLGRVLAKALGDMQYGYYDLARANFEDVIGFPNPEAFHAGRSEFIHNQTTIWDKQIIMVDEVSRAQRETANKWLEILGTRTLMGQKLAMKVVLGGMNPPEHTGAQPLPEAFADRFCLFVRLPEFSKMEQATREKILATENPLDAPSVAYWGQETPASEAEKEQKAAQNLRETLALAAERYRSLQEGQWATKAERYSDLFGRALLEAGILLEARRLKMIKRALLATMAVRAAQSPGQPLDQEEILACAAAVSRCCLPNHFTGQDEVSEEQVQAAHAQAAAALKGDRSELELFQAHSQAEKIALLLRGDYSPTVQEKVCADFLADQSLEADMAAWVCGQLILQDQAGRLPAHCLDRLAKRFQLCEDNLSSTSKAYVEPDMSCAEQLEAYAQAQQLVEDADERVDTRVACAWALSQSEGKPQRVIENYPKALSALNQAMETLRPLAIEWKLPGADAWQPQTSRVIRT